MNELTDEQINEQAATMVMGWTHKDDGICMGLWYSKDEDLYRAASSWNPAVDYNHAMVCRDRCSELARRQSYVQAITNLDIRDLRWELLEDLAFATARQITQACIRAVEGS